MELHQVVGDGGGYSLLLLAEDGGDWASQDVPIKEVGIQRPRADQVGRDVVTKQIID